MNNNQKKGELFMYISKKLFLITTVCLGLGFQINASQNEEQESNFFNFINKLRNVKNATALNLANWMESTYATDKDLSSQLVNIVNTDESVMQKTQAIEQLKQGTEQAETNKIGR